MLKILVVDDEPFILEGIAELLRSEERWEVFTAPGGRQALDILDRQRPDIVLSDIQMPGMDGIRLLQEIQVRWPFCKTIFLTAHSEFALAQKAIASGAFGYLLKADGDAAILDEIRRCEQKLDEEMRTQMDGAESRRKIEAAGPLLENAALLNILEWMPYDVAKNELSINGIDIDLEEPILLVAASIDNFASGSNSHERFQMMMEVEAIFNKYLSMRFSCHRASNAEQTMIWILQPLGGEASASLLYCRQSLETVQDAAHKALGLSLSIVYDDFIQFEKLHERYRQMLSILEQIIIQGEGRVLADSKFYVNRQGGPPTANSGSILRDLEAVRQALPGRDAAGFNDALHKVLYAKENSTAVRKLQTYHVVCGILLDFISQTGMDEEIFSRPEYFSLFQDYGGRASLFEGMSGLAAELIDKGHKQGESRSNALVQSIQHHIAANLAGNLSLQTVADTFFVNPAYLSRVFKNHTGVTVGEEITKQRMDLAKRMLARSEYRISDVAQQSGYESAAYFIRVFKKREGITPQAWREQCWGNSNKE
ncbi:response regulator [Ruminococcaceae bacterium OttesenSCG-928-A16]|nr:response regulator [Ruminococcaceae bacterium OttesenSCG-928-A16]